MEHLKFNTVVGDDLLCDDERNIAVNEKEFQSLDFEQEGVSSDTLSEEVEIKRENKSSSDRENDVESVIRIHDLRQPSVSQRMNQKILDTIRSGADAINNRILDSPFLSSVGVSSQTWCQKEGKKYTITHDTLTKEKTSKSDVEKSSVTNSGCDSQEFLPAAKTTDTGAKPLNTPKKGIISRWLSTSFSIKREKSGDVLQRTSNDVRSQWVKEAEESKRFFADFGEEEEEARRAHAAVMTKLAEAERDYDNRQMESRSQELLDISTNNVPTSDINKVDDDPNPNNVDEWSAALTEGYTANDSPDVWDQHTSLSTSLTGSSFNNDNDTMKLSSLGDATFSDEKVLRKNLSSNTSKSERINSKKQRAIGFSALDAFEGDQIQVQATKKIAKNKSMNVGFSDGTNTSILILDDLYVGDAFRIQFMSGKWRYFGLVENRKNTKKIHSKLEEIANAKSNRKREDNEDSINSSIISRTISAATCLGNRGEIGIKKIFGKINRNLNENNNILDDSPIADKSDPLTIPSKKCDTSIDKSHTNKATKKIDKTETKRLTSLKKKASNRNTASCENDERNLSKGVRSVFSKALKIIKPKKEKSFASDSSSVRSSLLDK